LELGKLENFRPNTLEAPDFKDEKGGKFTHGTTTTHIRPKSPKGDALTQRGHPRDIEIWEFSKMRKL